MDKHELMETARALVASDKGLLAMDESNPTCNKRFAKTGISETVTEGGMVHFHKRKRMMKSIFTAVALAGLFGLTGCSQTSEQPASAGPTGGDLVAIKDGSAYSELLANADTGEVMVHTWDKDLKTRRSIESQPITVGSGDNSVELTPHPMDTDPSGSSSRFYGEADWVRGGGIQSGWMHGGGTGDQHTFDWSRCWQGGQSHGQMWEEMSKHRGMGNMTGDQEHGTGHMGGRGER